MINWSRGLNASLLRRQVPWLLSCMMSFLPGPVVWVINAGRKLTPHDSEPRLAPALVSKGSKSLPELQSPAYTCSCSSCALPADLHPLQVAYAGSCLSPAQRCWKFGVLASPGCLWWRLGQTLGLPALVVVGTVQRVLPLRMFQAQVGSRFKSMWRSD